MTRVAVNLAWLVPDGVGGSEEYTVRLLDAVIDAAPSDIDLTVIGSPALFAAHPGLERVECVALRGPLHRRPWRIVAESTSVYTATRDADLVHHFGGRVPARHHNRNIVTIHDLQPLQMPENFSAVKRRYLEAALPRSVQAASLVVTPSEWVRSTVIDRLGADPAAVRSVPSTWDPESDVDSSLAASLPDGPVVLYPAVSHPHKRHGLLVEAMDLVAARAGASEKRGATLVLTGAPGRAEAAVDDAVARSTARVHRLGRVPMAALRGLYERADLLAFPSTYEGFGLPILEAMRAGVPVVAADLTAVPEVLGDTGTLVESDSPEAWAEAISAALHGGDEVESRVARARSRAERWSPAASAERLIEAWRSVASR